MAGEKEGIAFEAFVSICLRRLADKGQINGNIYWNMKPASVSVIPDLSVGPSVDEPSAVILVTHSGSAKDSDKKFWRNLGELAESKIQLPSAPLVIALSFDGVVKNDLRVIQGAVFDAEIHAGELPTGSALVKWIRANARSFPKKRQEVEALLDLECRRTPTLANALLELQTALLDALSTSSSLHSTLWKLARGHSRGEHSQPHPTYLRRAIAKVILVGDPDLLWSPRLRASDVPKFCHELGLIGPSIAGPVVLDGDLVWLRGALSKAIVSEIVSAAPVLQMKTWIDALRNSDALVFAEEYISKNWRELRSADGLHAHLVETSSGRFLKAQDVELVPGWLFEYLREAVKVSIGKKTGWGWSVLIRDLKALEADNMYLQFVAKVSGLKGSELSDNWSGYRTLTYSLPEWVMGDRDNFRLKSTDLPRLAYSLVPYLQNICNDDFFSINRALIREYYVMNYLEAKLTQYRNFAPLRDLITSAIRTAGLPCEVIERPPSVFREIAESVGARLNVRSCRTAVIRSSKTLLHWKSAHKGHANDKRKELYGRAVSLRYGLQGTMPHARTDVRKLILVVDGDWDAVDLSSLTRAGWDEIFYPDEMDMLVKAIV